MAALSAKARENLDDDDFCGPDRSYPSQNISHAGNAKARATQQLALRHISVAEYNSITACADKKIAEFKSGAKKEKR